MTLEQRSTSPDGRYKVCVDPFEARASQWVETPELIDSATDRALLALTDRYWHLDSADWRSQSVVIMDLRHFPDGRPQYRVDIDCEQLTASVDGDGPYPLGQLGKALERASGAPSPAPGPGDPI
ncbi:hypothetical protein A5745_11760 [Mycobacterium sp. IS-2888]|uniref:hypothetical protein n=1 Tax=Mycobacterium sp. IS-2888 TaxID=1834159 RepID=UPI00096E1AAE|nr:hypothetical protein [Mycobacterium sp. IS-2888]OMC46180.1 hypothetical protein A5745_11760 [Mycobacterium sp. IS-2888]